MRPRLIPESVRHVNTRYAPRHFKSKSAWLDYAAWLKRNTRLALSLAPEPRRTPLRPRIWGACARDGYTVEKVAFESMPGFFVTGNLFRPAAKASQRGAPGILCPHGHHEDGRLHDHDPLASVPARCVQLARMGAVVFSYDMVGYNDSCQLPHREFEADPHWGLSLMSLQTWNSIRALDFLLTLDEVDPSRIGVTGCSGGGTQTFALCAVDERVAAAAPIAMISYTMQGGCVCENAPLLRLDATSVDLARLFAPKPMFIGSCTRDWTTNTPKEEYPAVREVYRLLGAPGAVTQFQVDEEHSYNRQMREAVYGWFNKALFGARSAGPLKERGMSLPGLRERMVWWGIPRPREISPAAFRTMWRARAEDALAPHLRTPATARRTLGPLLPHALGVTPTSTSESAARAPEGVRIEASRGALVIASTGRGRDLSGTVDFYTAYNRCFVGDRVHEILAAVEKAGGRVSLTSRGEAGMWCLLAGALSNHVTSLDVDLAGFDPESDASWRKHLDVPCIRQIGGLATIFAMVGARPRTLRRATAEVRRLAQEYAR